MPISPMTFPMLTYDQANPVNAGLSSMNDIISGMLKNQQTATQNQYLGPGLQADVLRQQLANQLSQATFNSNVQQAAANVGLTKAQTGLTGVQAQWYPQKSQAEIGLEQAQTAQAQQEAKFAPLKMAIDAGNQQRLNSRFGPSFDLARTLSQMDPSQKDTWISNNQAAYNQMLADIGNSVKTGNSSLGILNPNFVNKFIPGAISTTSANVPQNGQSPAVSGPAQDQSVDQSSDMPARNIMTSSQQMPSVDQNATSGAPSQSQLPSDDHLYDHISNAIKSGNFSSTAPGQFTAGNNDQINQMKLMAQFNANRKSTTAPMNNRADNAAALESLLLNNRDKFSRAIQSATKYSGLIGQGQKGLQKLGQQSPQALQDYYWVQNSFIPNVANGVKLMEKMGATDQQRDELHGLVGQLNNWALNPKAAANSFNRNLETIQDVSDGVFNAAEPFTKGIYRQLHQIPRLNEPYVKSSSPVSSTPTSSTRVVQVITPDGSKWPVRADKLQEIMNRYPGTKVLP